MSVKIGGVLLILLKLIDFVFSVLSCGGFDGNLVYVMFMLSVVSLFCSVLCVFSRLSGFF